MYGEHAVSHDVPEGDEERQPHSAGGAGDCTAFEQLDGMDVRRQSGSAVGQDGARQSRKR